MTLFKMQGLGQCNPCASKILTNSDIPNVMFVLGFQLVVLKMFLIWLFSYFRNKVDPKKNPIGQIINTASQASVLASVSVQCYHLCFHDLKKLNADSSSRDKIKFCTEILQAWALARGELYFGKSEKMSSINSEVWKEGS